MKSSHPQNRVLVRCGGAHIPAPRRQRGRGRQISMSSEFKGILGYIVNSKPAKATGETLYLKKIIILLNSINTRQ